MDTVEQEMFSDVVRLVNRTKFPLEFMWDSKPYVIAAGASKHMPRHIAMAGVAKCKLMEVFETGQISESMFGIDEEGSLFPITPIDDDPKEVARRDKSGAPKTVLVNGKVATMKELDLKNPAPSFASV